MAKKRYRLAHKAIVRHPSLLPVGTVVKVAQRFLGTEAATMHGYDETTRGVVLLDKLDKSGAFLTVAVPGVGGKIEQRIPWFWEKA